MCRSKKAGAVSDAAAVHVSAAGAVPAVAFNLTSFLASVAPAVPVGLQQQQHRDRRRAEIYALNTILARWGHNRAVHCGPYQSAAGCCPV
jgi:hypothetical protein